MNTPQEPASKPRRFRTWQAEAAVVATALVVTAVASGGGREWFAAVGVLGSFLHAQVSDRMAESQAAAARPDVPCHAMSRVYFVVREIAWVAYFATGRCWSALVGCALFLAYPPWRRWWRSRHAARSSAGRGG